MFEWYVKDGCMEVNINKTAQLFLWYRYYYKKYPHLLDTFLFACVFQYWPDNGLNFFRQL